MSIPTQTFLVNKFISRISIKFLQKIGTRHTLFPLVQSVVAKYRPQLLKKHRPLVLSGTAVVVCILSLLMMKSHSLPLLNTIVAVVLLLLSVVVVDLL